MASPTQWTWVWASSGRWWRTGKPRVHRVAKSQARLSDWTTTKRCRFIQIPLKIFWLDLILIFLGSFHRETCPGTFSVQFSSFTQSCPTLCDPMNRSTPGLPVHHQLLEFTQTHVYWVGDAIQPSHPLSSPSPPAPNPMMLLNCGVGEDSWESLGLQGDPTSPF